MGRMQDLLKEWGIEDMTSPAGSRGMVITGVGAPPTDPPEPVEPKPEEPKTPPRPNPMTVSWMLQYGKIVSMEPIEETLRKEAEERAARRAKPTEE